MEDYKNAVAEACQCLAEARNKLFTAMVNVAMNGEYAELNESFDTGEFFYFEKNHFRDCEDINLMKLYEMVDHIDQTYASLVNLNGFDETNNTA
jgi:hypothetical protein